jgi:hypothetical protein
MQSEEHGSSDSLANHGITTNLRLDQGVALSSTTATAARFPPEVAILAA